jgi:hypothetical protein
MSALLVAHKPICGSHLTAAFIIGSWRRLDEMRIFGDLQMKNSIAEFLPFRITKSACAHSASAVRRWRRPSRRPMRAGRKDEKRWKHQRGRNGHHRMADQLHLADPTVNLASSFAVSVSLNIKVVPPDTHLSVVTLPVTSRVPVIAVSPLFFDMTNIFTVFTPAAAAFHATLAVTGGSHPRKVGGVTLNATPGTVWDKVPTAGGSDLLEYRNTSSVSENEMAMVAIEPKTYAIARDDDDINPPVLETISSVFLPACAPMRTYHSCPETRPGWPDIMAAWESKQDTPLKHREERLQEQRKTFAQVL